MKKSQPQRNCVVTRGYTSPYSDSVELRPGEEVAIARKKSEWPGWIWCTNSEGKSCWAPESILRISGDKAVVLSNYCSTELTVVEGEELSILDEESGWFWCLTRDDREGWVPGENVEIL